MKMPAAEIATQPETVRAAVCGLRAQMAFVTRCSG